MTERTAMQSIRQPPWRISELEQQCKAEIWELAKIKAKLLGMCQQQVVVYPDGRLTDHPYIIPEPMQKHLDALDEMAQSSIARFRRDAGLE